MCAARPACTETATATATHACTALHAPIQVLAAWYSQQDAAMHCQHWSDLVYLQIFSDKLVEVISMEDDFVWIHDYHLLVLPSLLRKRFHRLRCGLFLHSPFPSSEIWRTFPKREELLRSLLNVDLIGAELWHECLIHAESM